MATNNKNNDTHFLITVSDKQGTRHFRIPKILKTILLSTSIILSLGLIISNVIVFSQKGELQETKSMARSMEDAFVNITTKHDSLNKSLEISGSELKLISDIIAQMERSSGVDAELNASVIDRLTSISDYFAEKERDFIELDSRIVTLESSIGLPSEGSEAKPLEERIELASLNIDQQKILHDSIPNGYPTRNIGMTSKYGKRKHPTTKQASFHNGVDLKAALKTNVYATADGVIKESAFNKLSGNRIVIAHNFGFQSRYAHLNKLDVKPGDVVQKGDLIGLSGNTGRSDGPHLHYEVRHLEKPLNPIDFLKWEFGDQQIFTKVRGIQWHSLISLINKQITRPTLQLSQAALKSKAQ